MRKHTTRQSKNPGNKCLIITDKGVKEGVFKQYYIENGSIIVESDQGFSVFYSYEDLE